jgi:hypothetical protein
MIPPVTVRFTAAACASVSRVCELLGFGGGWL